MANSGASAAPLVTVITATYNWSSVLYYAIQSVLWQTFQEWEMWVIGDACTDDSEAVVASFNDPRVHWYNRLDNAGNQWLPNNDGLARARGKYIAYLGHDDLWYPTHLESLVEAIERVDADLAYSVIEWVGAPGTGIRCVMGINSDKLLQPRAAPSSVLHRHELIEKIGPWKDYRTLNQTPDIEFFQRIWAHQKRFINTNQLTAFKFPSGWRVNSYRERRSDEQAEYVRRIQIEPDFLANELFAIVEAYVAGKAAFPNLSAPADAGSGWKIDYYRKLRGLEAKAPLPDLAATGINRRRVVRPIRILLRRILGKLLQIVGTP